MPVTASLLAAARSPPPTGRTRDGYGLTLDDIEKALDA